MRLLFVLPLLALISSPAYAKHAAATPQAAKSADDKQVEVTADKSLEWYQDQSMYVARGNAKAVRGDVVIEADTLTAHQREKTKGAPVAKAKGKDSSPADIDKMTAEGHVRITDPREKIQGEHAVYDLDQHMAVVTGDNLKYETAKEIVTAKDSLEYWEDKKIAVARGHAVGVSGDRHVEGDVLTAEFTGGGNATEGGDQELSKITAEGHVTVITKGSVARGTHAVYDVNRNIAVLTGGVRVTRADGTQLTGDVAEVDFNNNQSRLLNNGPKSRVRALLVSKPASTKTAQQ